MCLTPKIFLMNSLLPVSVSHWGLHACVLGNFILVACVFSSLKLPIWLSGNRLVSINVATLCQSQLVPGWVTVFGRGNQLGTKPDTQVYSAWAIPPWVVDKYPAKAWGVNRQIVWYISPYLWSCLAEWLGNGDRRRLTLNLIINCEVFGVSNIFSRE